MGFVSALQSVVSPFSLKFAKGLSSGLVQSLFYFLYWAFLSDTDIDPLFSTALISTHVRQHSHLLFSLFPLSPAPASVLCQ